MKKQNIAITGSTGYIGGHLKNYFVQLGHVVYDMGRLPCKGNESHFIPFQLNKETNSLPLESIDVLIHCAYDFSVLGAEAIDNVNVKGSLRLFEQAKNAGVKKIISFSTTSAFAETSSDYGRAKYQIEQLAKPFDVLSVRPGLVFSKHPGGIVGAMDRLIQKLPVIPIIGKGDQIFFPCHIDDLSRLLEYLITHEVDSMGDPIVAASEQVITFKEMIKVLAAAHQKKVITISLPYHFLFMGLKCAELLKLKTGLRCDSLKYMKNYNENLNFHSLQQMNFSFRPFTLESLRS